MGPSQLGYVGIGVSDVDAWEKYATEILGMQANGRGDEGELFLRMDEQHHRFAIHPGGNDDVAYVGWAFSDDRALRDLENRLQSNGIEFTEGSPDHVAARRVRRLIRFQDPNGVALEAYYAPLMLSEDPFNSPRGIDFVTKGLGLGHVVFGVDDFDESLHFYTEVLGMRISDFIDLQFAPGQKKNTVAFLRCNPRHHSMAFTAAPLAKRLLHFMVEVENVDQVGVTSDLCEAAGIQIARTLGRHPNDLMLSFYMRTPSETEVEFGCGAREVDEATWEVQTYQVNTQWGHKRLIPFAMKTD